MTKSSFLLPYHFSETYTDCNVTESFYSLTENNELTIYWNVTSAYPTVFCQNVYIDIELSLDECTPDTNKISECTDKIKQIQVMDLSYTFAYELETCAEYEYRVYEENSTEATFKGEFYAHEKFEQITIIIEQISDSSINVSWPYGDYPHCRLAFVTTVRDGLVEKKKLETDALFEEITDLEPCETYEITVKPVARDNIEQPQFGDATNYTMNEVMPTKILRENMNVAYIEADLAIEINWDVPTTSTKCIDIYKVLLTSDTEHRSTTTKLPKEKLANVYACEPYTVQVNIFNAPSLPNFSDLTYESVVLTTSVTETNENNNCQLTRVQFMCNSTLNSVRKDLRVSLSLPTISIEMTGLTPFTDYSCYARAESTGYEEDFSPFSYGRSITTKQGSELHKHCGWRNFNLQRAISVGRNQQFMEYCRTTKSTSSSIDSVTRMSISAALLMRRNSKAH